MKRKLQTAAFVVISLVSLAIVMLDSMGRDLFPGKLDPSLTGSEPSVPEGTFCIMTYNIAHGRGTGIHQALTGTKRIRNNLDAVAQYVANVSPDVAGFQEVDIDCNWSGNFNHAEHVRDKSGYPHVCYGVNNVNEGDYRLNYGNAIVSKHPIISHENHAFGDAAVGEKGFVVADIEIDGVTITFTNAHLDFKHAKNRRRQVEKMVEILKQVKHPLVVMGDFNCELDGGEDSVRFLVDSLGLSSWKFKRGECRTFPSHKPNVGIDFVFISDEMEFVGCVAPAKVLSDHLPVIAVIKMKNHNILEGGRR